MIDEIRLMGAADAQGLIALWRETWRDTYENSLGAEAVASMFGDLDRHQLSGMLPGHGERGYCAIASGRIIGSTIIAERGATAYLWGMYIHPDYQTLGIGSHLLAAIAQGITVAKTVELRALASSHRAVAFYTRRGFRQTGEEMSTLMSSLEVKTLVMSAEVDQLIHIMGNAAPRLSP
jgi:ribosomal protein S18 acetylase RimI-like enzyme